MARRQIPRFAIAGLILVLLIVVGGVFVLIAELTGDKTKNQEHAGPATSHLALVQPSGRAAGR